MRTQKPPELARAFSHRVVKVEEWVIVPTKDSPLHKVKWNLTYPNGKTGFVIGVGETLGKAQADARAKVNHICNFWADIHPETETP